MVLGLGSQPATYAENEGIINLNINKTNTRPAWLRMVAVYEGGLSGIQHFVAAVRISRQNWTVDFPFENIHQSWRVIYNKLKNIAVM